MASPSKEGMVERYKTTDPLTNSPVLLYKWKHCRAMVYVGDEEKWATVSLIETHPDHRNQGQATELMIFLQKLYEKQSYKFGGTVALNPAMARVYEKTGVLEYSEIEENE